MPKARWEECDLLTLLKLKIFFIVRGTICIVYHVNIVVKLILKIKLLPTQEQENLLLNTIKEANAVCNAISEVTWQEKVFNTFKLHHKVYHAFKSTFQLSSQIIVRQISKETFYSLKISYSKSFNSVEVRDILYLSTSIAIIFYVCYFLFL